MRATSKSRYVTDPASVLTTTDNFDLEFVNPCMEFEFTLEQSMIEDIEYQIGTGVQSVTH